ncbi:MAG: hypothetical protein KC502_18950, partial [Myxococcales bacterium]|nr:hypothetical protein [Myxococcales bacterium]
MFEVAELGRKLDKATFKTASADVRTRLLIAQQKLRNAKIPVIVVVSGVEGAGKTDVVNRMSEWLDTRGLQTHSFWEQSDDERRRPPYWRFWRRLPPRGTIGVMFGSWYTQPILDRATDQIDNLTFDASMHTIARFERLLSLDGALIVKLWLHLPKKELCDRIDEDDARGGTKATSAGGSSKKKAKKSGKKGKKRGGKKKKKHRDDIRLDGGIGQFMGDEVRGLATEGDWSRGAGIKAWNVSPLARKFAERYEAFAEASERAIRATDSGASRWHLIEATDRHYRDLTAAQVLLDALEHRLLAQEAEDAVLANGAAASPEPVLTLTESAAPERAATPGQIWQRIEQDQPTILDR